MSDLISRQKAIETLKECEVVESDNFTRTDPVTMMTVATIADCIEAIVELPSEEPERKTGKWIDGMPYVNSHWKVCSECHVSAPDSCGGFNFCPNCGAEMRGE